MLKNILKSTEYLTRKKAITRLKLKEKLEPREGLLNCRKCKYFFDRSVK